jgi:hypothetical protein
MIVLWSRLNDYLYWLSGPELLRPRVFFVAWCCRMSIAGNCENCGIAALKGKGVQAQSDELKLARANRAGDFSRCVARADRL